MIVLAIDPGSVTAGYALLEKQGRHVRYIASGILKFDAKKEFILRVKDIVTQTQQIVDSYKPDQIALESLIFVKSPTALIKLAQSRGAMLGVLAQDYEGKIFEYSPNLVKSTVVGHGHADKEGIQKFLQTYLGLSDFKTHDESDAIAIALCHILQNQNISLASAMAKTPRVKSKGRGLAASVSHKVKGKEL